MLDAAVVLPWMGGFLLGWTASAVIVLFVSILGEHRRARLRARDPYAEPIGEGAPRPLGELIGDLRARRPGVAGRLPRRSGDLL